ncbi:unnamed protein product [Orchesella dallaii]|uniref:Nuclear pore complex protein n=1 Tax=Orchesella dallaii TaxID=48710 RepID=A0ABP1PTU7_9HEXA
MSTSTSNLRNAPGCSRSMISIETRSDFELEPDAPAFEKPVLKPRRPRLTLTALQGNDLIKATTSLHKDFGASIQAMSKISIIFEVVRAWMKNLDVQIQRLKKSKADRLNSKVGKLINHLQQEYETWSLIQKLYEERARGTTKEMPFTEKINPKFLVNEEAYVMQIVRSDSSLQEMYDIIQWLENNFKKYGEPNVNEKDSNLGSTSTATSQEQIEKVSKNAYHYIRTGRFVQGIDYIAKSGNMAKAEELNGHKLTYLCKVNTITGEERRVGIIMGRKFINAQSGSQSATPDPEIQMRGNPQRDVWKSTTWKKCESKQMSKYELAINGALCGHLGAMLDVAQTWEDNLWSFLRASTNTITERRLRAACTQNLQKPLPKLYWSQALPFEECLRLVDAISPAVPPDTFDGLIRNIQKYVLLNKVEDLVEYLREALPQILEACDDPLLNGHVARFLSHLMLFLLIAGLADDSELLDICITKQINVLVDNGYFQEIPYYIDKLSDTLRIPNVVRYVKADKPLRSDEIELFLKACHDNKLNVLGIAKAVLDKMEEEQDDFSLENLNWIIYCLKLHNNLLEVVYEFLHFIMSMSRKYLTLGKISNVQDLFGQVDREHFGQMAQDFPGALDALLREYDWYQTYLVAEDSLEQWKTALSQQPTIGELRVPNIGTLAGKRAFEKQRKDNEVLQLKWEQLAKIKLDISIANFFAVLSFPSGSLCESGDATNEAELIAVGAVRHVIIQKVVHALLDLMQDKNYNAKMQELADILFDDELDIFRAFKPSEIGNIFKLLSKYI